MALNNYYRATDLGLMFSNAYALTVTTATYSTTLDLGSGANMGQGQAVRGIVQVTGITATAASTLIIALCASSASTPTTVVATYETHTGSSSFEEHFTLPADIARYVNLKYTLSGTAASACTITAFLTSKV